LVVSVVLDEPRQGYYGGDVCAPLFGAVVDQIAPRLGIPADRGVANATRTLARSSLSDSGL